MIVGAGNMYVQFSLTTPLAATSNARQMRTRRLDVFLHAAHL